jgi:hypothetical protein
LAVPWGGKGGETGDSGASWPVEGARKRWRDQVEQLDEEGRLTAPIRELVESWARAWDTRESAVTAWEDADSPESQRGSLGQEQRHHLAVAVERATRHLHGLTAKLERAANRRVPRTRIPAGARVVGRLVGGGVSIVWRGRLYQQSVLDASERTLSWDEVRVDHGDWIRWLDREGTPVFFDPPASRSGPEGDQVAPSIYECRRWARARGIPVAAVEEWLARLNRRSRWTIRDDADVAEFLLERDLKLLERLAGGSLAPRPRFPG